VAVKPGPEMTTLLTVTLELPELVSVAERLLLVPRVTLPNVKVEELGLTVPGAVTVKVAAALVTLPAELLTRTVNCTPLSAVVSAGVV
jgi:hypothetical protein